MRDRLTRYFMADFETTVYPGQTDTAVWAAAIVEIGTEDVQILASLDSFMRYIFLLTEQGKCDLIIYFHNLKFDGSFILSWLKEQPTRFRDSYNPDTKQFRKPWELSGHEYSYNISRKGQWYKISLMHRRHYIEFRDSFKLLPFSVKQLGSSFGTKHHKLTMEYEGYREPEGKITPEERAYIANDVLVVKEALEIMFAEGHRKLTIGACCLAEFKSGFIKPVYEALFPNLFNVPLDTALYGYDSIGKFIQKSYHGAWCYLVPGKANKILHNGVTLDVNSLYPYVMHSDSGFRYPVGIPTFWTGNYIPSAATQPDKYYFIRFRTRFKIKPGKLPTIQIKNSLYPPKEWLTSSDIKINGHYSSHYRDRDGSIKAVCPEFIMTMWDYKLMLAHYNLTDTVILGGCYFDSLSGIFDDYIDKYKKIKMTSKGAKRTEAKLFSNNLYGKMAASPDSSFKVASLDNSGRLVYTDVEAHDKAPGYIPIGSAITSHARYYTITHAQLNYHGADKPGFVYADTDSLHGDMPLSDWKGIETDPAVYGKWKCETCWDTAKFIMAKTYLEHVTHNDLGPVTPYWNVTAAGMPAACKTYIARSLEGIRPAKREHLPYRIKVFLRKERTLDDIKPGLAVPGALKAESFKGGTLLVSRDHTLR